MQSSSRLTNEASTIGDVIQQVPAVDLPGIEKVVIMADDGSSDRTAEIARSKGVLVVRHCLNRGLGVVLSE